MKNPFKNPDSKPVVAVPALQKVDVWKAPADYNRATRRWAQLWGSIWAWEPTPAVAPRYTRRHFTSTILSAPKTRRERRHKARILRAMQSYR